MKRFHFPLERVLKFRRTQADIEKAKLAAIEGELKKIRDEIESLAQAFADEVRTVAATPTARAELGRYRMVVEYQTHKLTEKLHRKQAELEQQRLLYTRANQAAEVLEKVKTKQKQGWERELQKELDELAMDSFLARWKN
jgi:flagellar export protein FliJ